MIAALYVETDGAYFDLEGVYPWDERRDARNYPGPYPVVAHPPCAAWSVLSGLREAMTGKPRHEDGGCFKAALDAVNTWGGVLEHPANSAAFHHFHLPRPVRGQWLKALFGPGWVTEVSQVAYGHRATKRTWLYYVGPEPPALDWSEPPATARVSEAHGDSRDGLKRMPMKERRATPERFRELLLDLARLSL